MAIDLEQYQSLYFTWDLPVEIHDISIKPILMKDYLEFAMYSFALTINKEEIPDAKIISMSYLEFILYKYEQGDMLAMVSVIKIMEIVTGAKFEKKELEINKLNNKIILRIFDKEITSKQFDDIRRLIMYQNLPNYDDSYIDPNLKKDIEEYHKIKNGNIEFPNLEKQILVMMTYNYDLDTIMKMSVRKFIMLFSLLEEKNMYNLQKSAELSGMVTFKEDVEHWIYKNKKGKYDGATVNYESFRNNIDSVMG